MAGTADIDLPVSELPGVYLSARGGAAPTRAVVADDRLTADVAFRLTSQGVAIVWTSDYPNARQLLEALGSRFDKRRAPKPPDEPAAAFHGFRQLQAQRAQILGLILVPLTGGRISLPRGPDITVALHESIGVPAGDVLIPLRDVLAIVSAHEWRKNGVPIPALGRAKIHPHYGVFPPTRQDYIDLVASAPLPAAEIAFDLGTGSGVLAALLLHRGVRCVVATDNAPRALGCAADNFERLGLSPRVTLAGGHLYPDGRANLIVCNPPWLPGKSATSLESAVYDPDSSMLRGFLDGAVAHLLPGGEAWLVLSDLAEHLGLRTRDELLRMIGDAGLKILDRLDAPPSPRSARNADDPLYLARSAEAVSLWRLGAST